MSPVSPVTIDIPQVRRWVELNSRSLALALSEAVKDHSIVLVGDRHIDRADSLRHSVAAQLPKLKLAGLQTVAVELNESLQARVDQLHGDFEMIRQQVKSFAPVGWFEGNCEIVAMAKALSLKVLCIDAWESQVGPKSETAHWYNSRESAITKALSTQINKDEKVLVVIGDDHVHKMEVKSYDDGKIIPLGQRLSRDFGVDHVISFRICESKSTFDGLFFSSAAKVADLLPTTYELPLVLPNKGPARGDPRVANSDHVIVF